MDETLELADGTQTGTEINGLPQDSSQQFDSINPVGNVSFDFKEGNYKELSKIPAAVTQFIESFSRTFIPLVEVALVELLGNSSAYDRTKCDVTLTVQGNKPRVTGTLLYTVEMWIGDDVDQQAIAKDAKYVYDKLAKIPNLKITSCRIDCLDGTLTVEFSLSA
jgi:hypothetical protein